MVRSSPARCSVLRVNPIARGFAIALALGSGTAIAAGASAPRGASAPARPFIPMAVATGSLPAPTTTRFAHDVTAPPRRLAALDGIPHVPSSSIAVTNCEDSGPGSLRDNNGFEDDVIGQNTFAFTGANNLIQAPWSPVRSDTLTNLDPMLSPLAFNGGPTQTHALSFDSPAVDAGNDAASVSFDQRGPGFARVIGANPDIGAFEANTDDRIFADGFD